MVTKNLYLMRHGETSLNGCYVGSTDIGLSEPGVKQVKRTASLLQNCVISKVFCSPMSRCRQTLELLHLSCSAEFDPIIREIDFGRWETKCFSEIAASDSDLVDAWATEPDTFSFPDGESISNFSERVASFKNRLYECVEKDILVVAHGGVIRHLICDLLGLTPDKYLVFQVLPGTFSTLRLHTEGGVLTGFNITG